MKQSCHLSMVWLTWLGLPALAILGGVLHGWVAGVAIAVVALAAQIAYLKAFPRLSRWLGYGSVDDVPAEGGPATGRLGQVTLYTANVCPFCPILKRRLERLRSEMGFEVNEVDVTFRPGLLTGKGFRSVPVVEANGRFLAGNATSAELVAFLNEASGEST